MIVDARAPAVKENKQREPYGSSYQASFMRHTDDSYRAPTTTTSPRHSSGRVSLQARHCSKALRLAPPSAHDLNIWELRLGEGVETRARCCNATKWDVSVVTNVGLCSRGTLTLLTLVHSGLYLSIVIFRRSTLVHSGLEFRFGLRRERCGSQG